MGLGIGWASGERDERSAGVHFCPVCGEFCHSVTRSAVDPGLGVSRRSWHHLLARNERQSHKEYAYDSTSTQSRVLVIHRASRWLVVGDVRLLAARHEAASSRAVAATTTGSLTANRGRDAGSGT